MADNKKKKVDFREALRAQQPAPDFIEVKLKGTSEPVRIARGNHSDEEWEAAKVQASKAGEVVSSLTHPQTKEGKLRQEEEAASEEMAMAAEGATRATEKLSAENARRLSWPRLLRLGSNLNQVADSVISPDEKEQLKDIDEWSRADFIRQRLQHRGYEVPPEGAAEAKKVFGKPAVQEKTAEQKAVDQLEDEEEGNIPSASAVTGSTPMARAASMAQQGATGAFRGVIPTRESKLAELREGADAAVEGMRADEVANQKLADRPLDLQIEAAAAAQDMQGQAAANTRAAGINPETGARIYGQNNVEGDGLPPKEPSFIDQAVPVALVAARGAGNMLLGPAITDKVMQYTDPISQPNEQQPAARQDLEAPVAAPPMQEQPPPTQMQPPMPGQQSAGVSMRTSIPGSAPPPSGVDLAAAKKQIDDAATVQQMALGAQADAESRRLEQEVAIRNRALDEQAKLQVKETEMRAAQADTMQKYQAAYQQTINQLQELSKESVDPNRFWSNQSDGQKAAAVIAGALFGFTGQGMQWLQRLDSLVERDIQAQAADLARRRGVLGDIAGSQQNLVAMARQQGLDDMAAVSAARAAMKEQLATQLEANAATFGQEAVRAKAMAGAAALRESAVKDKVEFDLKAQQAAAQNMQARAAWVNANTNRMELGLRASRGAGSGTQEMKPAQQERIAELMNLGDSLGNMWSDYQRMAGGRGSIPGATGAAALTLPAQVSDAALWNTAKADEYTQLIGKPLEGGVVREEDTKRYRKSYIPNATDTEKMAREKVDTLVKYAADKYKNEYRSLVVANVDGVQRLPTPEQYEAQLRARAAGVNFTPSKR